jgi:hypothetical protein
MTNLALYRESTSHAITLPAPRNGGIEVREAAPGTSDLAFIDELQKMHTKMVGWMPKGQLETYIKRGQVLIAEQSEPRPSGSGAVAGDPSVDEVRAQNPLPYGRGSVHRERVGYCIFSDKYLKREELGIVYQLNVLPIKQRGLIGATLLKEVFQRAAYGCKLFCCWCAQDLEANHFWESMGFIPLAFRTGSRKAGAKKEPRTHIFWQRRIREGDTDTPYWFPSETSGGAIRENRLVLPIPPGTHWSDAKPAVLPGMEQVNVLPEGYERAKRSKAAPKSPKPPTQEVQPQRPSNGVWFAPPEPPPPTPDEIAKAKEEKKKAKAERPKPPRFKNDPKLVAAARELRDRYTEQINAGLLLPPSACGKYDVSRALEHAPTVMKVGHDPGARLLDAA